MGWSLLIAAYYLALGYFIVEPTPLGAWLCSMWQRRRRQRRTGGSNAGMDERLGNGDASDRGGPVCSERNSCGGMDTLAVKEAAPGKSQEPNGISPRPNGSVPA